MRAKFLDVDNSFAAFVGFSAGKMILSLENCFSRKLL